mmetsp:Transcript_30832/g.69220  ORF Transcript_30832/g.69220 Transcript_30832/m.69220 type:complete len:305 (-) Transcript_30832:184-1098(-)|eukprot:CAMPEP_0172601700 /NCGR_PEP_ID=MMETSP1068-20121228/21877_1 /TAXON_ID=35684 /ORGANISM="Pseudopedinella elastica, Strain CCMP716" /LENGTH=304 /DNA_ID=CAMNT_0013402791 /DNA_START=56 /DNA_END=970 /DNA_ORIENTATION=+
MALSYEWRCGVAASYIGLLGVNTIYGAGLFGVPTNGMLSAAYPSHVTPAGFTFAIWGPIFVLQAGGTALIALGGAPELSARIAPFWVSAWAAECAWQFTFAALPMPAKGASVGRRLVVLIPASLFLLAAQAAMLTGCVRLRDALTEDKGRGSILATCLLCIPTAANAAWLAAASGIGLSLVAQLLPSPFSALATEPGAAALLALVTGGAVFLTPWLGGTRATLGLGLGYGAATAWACFGMGHGDAPPAVKAVALGSLCGMGVSTALTVAVAACPIRDPPTAGIAGQSSPIKDSALSPLHQKTYG